MRIYLAVATKQFIQMMKEIQISNVLISYAYVSSFEKLNALLNGFYPNNLLLDSGAFSVWANNRTIDIDEFAVFALDVISKIPKTTKVHVVNLDVLPGKFGERPTHEQREQSAEAGWKNMLYLESLGLKVIPVFHQHEQFEWLHQMISHTDYIGISPANDVSQKEKERWLDRVFSITKDKIKTHGFAVTAYASLVKYPFYSVDSSSWSAGGRFGRIPIFINGKVKSFIYKDKKELLKYWNDLPTELTAVLGTHHDRNRIGILAYKLFEEFITRLWTEREIKWEA